MAAIEARTSSLEQYMKGEGGVFVMLTDINEKMDALKEGQDELRSEVTGIKSWIDGQKNAQKNAVEARKPMISTAWGIIGQIVYGIIVALTVLWAETLKH